MWEAIFVKPVLNLLILIQNFMPGQDLGLAILVFTIIVRVLMWPLIKKQIHQTRIMQKVTPEINAIRAKSKGSKDREVLQKVNAETMAVYRKHGISPFASIGTLLVQLPLFIAIYSAVRTAFTGTENLSRLLYGPIENLSYVKSILVEGGRQITTFADWADLARRPFSNNEVYGPVLAIALASIVIQYFQVKQTMPPKKKSLTNDPSEKLNNATPYIMVVLFGWISLSVEGAISFYLAAGSLVAIFQQAYLMNQEKQAEEVKETKKPTVTVISEKESKQISKQAKAEKNVAKTKTAPKSKPNANPKKNSTPAKKKPAQKKKTPGKTPKKTNKKKK
jgi:YidC/Oxa1 family membrane protein insertase